MKITFIKSHQSPMSGNSFYEAGTRADLPQGAALIAGGIAREGWNIQGLAKAAAEHSITRLPPQRALSSMTVKQLREIAKKRGINQRKTKAALIEAINAHSN